MTRAACFWALCWGMAACQSAPQALDEDDAQTNDVQTNDAQTDTAQTNDAQTDTAQTDAVVEDAASEDGGQMTEQAARYLALGDSYTIGESVEPAGRWPVQLVGLLRAEGLSVEDPEIIARTGWTTDELDQGIDAAQPQGPYRMVSLLIGVNNQYRGRSAEAYRVELQALLARAAGFGGGEPGRVLVLSIPDWGVTPFGQRSDPARVAVEIDQFNAIKREEALRFGARFVDVTPISRRASQEPGLVAEDGLHPSAAMYGEWARLALPDAMVILR